MTTEHFVFFYGGPFSQWYPQSFVLHGVEYSCAEQCMMASKAALFEDRESYKKIMDTRNPKEQKALGRLVKGFEVEKWNNSAKEIVFEANHAKFSKNPFMKQMLLDTGDRELVEASPFDKIWGIGMDTSDPDVLDKTKWRGTNWLGEALMRVRKSIR